jgi:hypothetical protein
MNKHVTLSVHSTFFCVLFLFVESSRNLTFREIPPGVTCSVHIKTTSSHDVKQHCITEELIIANPDTAVWTVWSNNLTYVKPIAEFFEQCSINILIEASATLKKENIFAQQRKFFHSTKYIGRGPLHSIYVLIKAECPSTEFIHQQAYMLSMTLYVHFLNECREQPVMNNTVPSDLFPSHFFLPVSEEKGSQLVKRKDLQSIFQTRPVKRTTQSFKIDCLAMDPGNQTRPCLQSFLKQEDMASRNYCLYRDFVNQHLQSILNFTCNHYSYTAYMNERVRSKFGYILFDVYVDKHSSLQGLANPKTSEESIKSQIAYCNFRTLERRLSVEAWIRPIQMSVWIALIGTIAACACYTFLAKMKTTLNSVSFETYNFLSHAVIATGILLRQHSTKSRQILLTLLSLATLTISSMYESLVTVELLVPHKPTQVNDLAELVHGLKYKIVLQGVIKLEQDLNLENLNDYLRRVKCPNLLTTQHVIFMNRTTNMNKNLSRESKKRVASLVQATSEKSKDQLRVLNIRNPKANCQFVKKILGYELIFLVFGNAMGQIQMQLFKQFYHSGLIEHWKQLATSQSEAVNGRSHKFKTFTDTQILLRSLIPVYFLCVSLLTSAVFVLLAEMSVERCSKNYLARRKGDLLTTKHTSKKTCIDNGSSKCSTKNTPKSKVIEQSL